MSQQDIEFYSAEYSETYSETSEDSLNFTSTSISYQQYTSTASFEDEPPLWEELGFDSELIRLKTIALLGKRSSLNDVLINDTDLGGPFIYCLLLGCALILGGKFHFGYIFGYCFCGSMIMWFLLNLMSERGIGVYHTMSVLGYCLAPMIGLALTALIFPPTHFIGFLLAVAAISYCTYSASFMFTRVLMTTDEGALFAYPIGLLYTCFALIVLF